MSGVDIRDDTITIADVGSVAIWGGTKIRRLSICNAHVVTLRGVSADEVELMSVEHLDWEHGTVGDPAGPRSKIILDECASGRIALLEGNYGICKRRKDGGLTVTSKNEGLTWGGGK